MRGEFPFSKLPKYPHLRTFEILIWERFLDKFPDFFSSVDYDVKVGTKRKAPLEAKEEYKKSWEELSLKRIDVVGYKNEEVSIIEIKPSAELEAIGQLICYKELFIKKRPEIKKVNLLLLTDFELPDMKELTQKQKIEYLVLE